MGNINNQMYIYVDYIYIYIYNYCANWIEEKGFNKNILTDHSKKPFQHETISQFRDKVHELCRLRKNTMKKIDDNDEIVEVLNNGEENDNNI